MERATTLWADDGQPAVPVEPATRHASACPTPCVWLAPGPWPVHETTNRRIYATAARASSRAITRTSLTASPAPTGDTSAARDEPVILNPRTGRRRGTAEFLGRDEERARPSPQSRRLAGRLGRPRRCVWCSPRFACLENTPVLQPRTMKRADAAQTANPASRPEKPGKMKSQRFSSPLIVRPLTVVAIDGLCSGPSGRDFKRRCSGLHVVELAVEREPKREVQPCWWH